MIKINKIINEYKKINTFSYKCEITEIEYINDHCPRSNGNILVNYFNHFCSAFRNVLYNFISNSIICQH